MLFQTKLLYGVALGALLWQGIDLNVALPKGIYSANRDVNSRPDRVKDISESGILEPHPLSDFGREVK